MFLWGEHKMPTHAINGDMKTLDLLSIKLPGRCKRGGDWAVVWASSA